jgi:hypothetical protein
MGRRVSLLALPKTFDRLGLREGLSGARGRAGRTISTTRQNNAFGVERGIRSSRLNVAHALQAEHRS